MLERFELDRQVVGISEFCVWAGLMKFDGYGIVLCFCLDSRQVKAFSGYLFGDSGYEFLKNV